MWLRSVIIIFLFSALLSHAIFAQQMITHYIFPRFVDGVVLMKNGRKNITLINYNTISEEMIFVKGSLKLAIGNTETQLIDTIYMEGRKFISLEGKFVELLYHSESLALFIQYKCKIAYPGKDLGFGQTNKTIAVEHYGTLYEKAFFYKLKLPDDYKTDPFVVYWIRKDGIENEAENMRQLKRVFGKEGELFKAYVRSNHVKIEDVQKVTSLVKCLDSLR